MTHPPAPGRSIAPPPQHPVLEEPWSPGKVGRLLALFGPAAIVASVAIGAGETIIVVRAGAWAGYGLLWMVLLSVLVKGVFVTYLLGRYTAISGESLGQRLVKAPGPRGWLLLLLVGLELLAAGPLWAAIARPCGELLTYLLFPDGVPADALWTAPLVGALFVALALGLSLLLSYERLERQQLVICGVLVAGTITGTLLVQPDLFAAARGFLAFGHVPDFPPWMPAEERANPLPLLAVTFGYVGGSVMTYLVYAEWIALHGWGMTGHPEIERIRRWAADGAPGDYLPSDPQQAREIRRAAGPVRWDVGFGAAVLLIVAGSFMLAGAAVLYAQGEPAFRGWSLLTDQASIWQEIHPSLAWVYYVCVVAALWGTLQAYPDIYARGIAEYGRDIWPHRRWDNRRIQRWVCIYVFVAASAFLLSGADFRLLTMITAFLATNLGVAVAMVAALYLNFQLPPAYRTRTWVLIGGYFSAAVLLAVSAISAWGLFGQLGD